MKCPPGPPNTALLMVYRSKGLFEFNICIGIGFHWYITNIDFTSCEMLHLYGLSHSPFKEMYDMYSHLYIVVIGSHKKPVEPVEPVVSDTMSSQSGSSFTMSSGYSDHVSTGDGLR